MKLSDFDYALPDKLIAQKPISPRDSSRLMIISDEIEHKKFYDIIDYFKKGDVLVVNDTKVIPAKLIGKKTTGAYAELIVEEIISDNICIEIVIRVIHNIGLWGLYIEKNLKLVKNI